MKLHKKRGRHLGLTLNYYCENCPWVAKGPTIADARREALRHGRETGHALRGNGERLG